MKITLSELIKLVFSALNQTANSQNYTKQIRILYIIISIITILEGC